MALPNRSNSMLIGIKPENQSVSSICYRNSYCAEIASMKIQHEQSGNTDIFHIIGKLNIYTKNRLEEAIGQVMNLTRKRIVLQLQQMEFIDSSGIGLLIKLLSEIRARKKELVLVGLSDTTLKIFTNASLSRFFTIMNDKDFQSLIMSELDPLS